MAYGNKGDARGSDAKKRVAGAKRAAGGDAHVAKEAKSAVTLPDKRKVFFVRDGGSLDPKNPRGPIANVAYRVGNATEVPTAAKAQSTGKTGFLEPRPPPEGVVVEALGTTFQLYVLLDGQTGEALAWQELGLLGYHALDDFVVAPLDVLRFQYDASIQATGALDAPTQAKIHDVYTDLVSKNPVSA